MKVVRRVVSRQAARGGDFMPISEVARRYEIHPQTLRLWERGGLIVPARSQGNSRLYDREALDRLELLLRLTRDLGVNLAGVEIILDLRTRLEAATSRAEQLESRIGEALRRRHGDAVKRDGLVRVTRGVLVRR